MRNLIAVFGLLLCTWFMLDAIVPNDLFSASEMEKRAVISETPEKGTLQNTQPETMQQETDSIGSIAVTEMAGNVSYYYNSLNPQEKELYGQIYTSIITRENGILETVNDDVVDKVYQCVMNDHPEVFYSSAYRVEKQLMGGEVVRMTFTPNYHMTEEEVTLYKGQIEDYVNRCMQGLAPGADEYDKVKYVYEYVIENTEYVRDCPNNQNICSVFLNGQSVCQGYAKATQYLLSRMGVEATLAYGKVGNEFHSWNLVRVDGEYYYMDPTWGDAGYVRPGSNAAEGTPHAVNYEYFLITTKQISKSHVIDNVVPLPACVSARNNYYVREGLYLQMYDEATVKSIFDRGENNADGFVTFMCSDEVVYTQAKDELITNQRVFDYLGKAQSVSYTCNDDLYTLIFWIE